MSENVKLYSMDGEIQPDPEQVYLTEEDRRFVVDNDQKADWAARAIGATEEDTKKWKEFYEKRFEEVRKANDFRIGYMKRLLKDYFFTVPHKQARTQSSYALPSGKLIMKAQAPEYERDDEQLLAWLHESNMEQFIKVKEVVDWGGLKKALEGDNGIAISNGQVITPDGEIVPGITVVERPNVFKVEVK